MTKNYIMNLDTKLTTTVVKEMYDSQMLRIYNLRNDGVLFVTDLYFNLPSFCETAVYQPEDEYYEMNYDDYIACLIASRQ